MGADILILTIYFICVLYVLYQMALSVEANLEDQVQIVLDAETLNAAIAPQLAQQNRSDLSSKVVSSPKLSYLELTFPLDKSETGRVQIQVNPQGERPLQPPIQQLAVSVINGLPDQQVFIDWDSSSISVHGGLAYRVIRQVPGMPTDLFQPQVYTVTNPGQVVNVGVTSEALFRRPENALSVQSAPVLIDLERIPEMKEPLRTYSIRLLVWVKSMTQPDLRPVRLLVPFNFRIEVLPDHVALPILSWLLDLFTLGPKMRSR